MIFEFLDTIKKVRKKIDRLNALDKAKKSKYKSVRKRAVNRKGALVRKTALSRIVDNPTGKNKLIPGIRHKIKRKG